MNPADFLKFGELGVIFAALAGAFLLLRDLPSRIGSEVGASIGKAMAESELRTADRISELESSLRGTCRYGHTSPPASDGEEDIPRIPRQGRLKLESHSG